MYAIGSIASDDSGSFDVTFTANDLSAVPLVVSWKDSSGNDYNITKTLDLSSDAGTAGTASSSTTGTQTSSGLGQLHDGRTQRRYERRTRWDGRPGR